MVIIMETFGQIITRIDDFVWGPVMLILLVGTGLYLQIGLKIMPIRKLGQGVRLLLQGSTSKSGGNGEISSFGALMAALSATVGVGNIAGVATAIALGGPGAVFWMWVTGLVGMATKYAEAVLAVRFREVDGNGDHCGGPMYYLRNGLGSRGRWLGGAFATFATFAAFGIGSAVQANSVADGLEKTFSMPHWSTGALMALLVVVVTIGGIKRIAKVTSGLVPFMIVVYLLAGCVVLAINADKIGYALDLIFGYALAPAAAVGGVTGAAVVAAMRFGVARACLNEAGLAARRSPCRGADEQSCPQMIAMIGVFIDTIVVCTFTALVIISSGAWKSGETGVSLTQESFNTALPGIGEYIVTLSVMLFAYSTSITWSFYGEKAFQYLFGLKLINGYRLVFALFCLIGATTHLDLVWLMADAANGLMAIPNLIGLALLSPLLFTMTRDYFAGRPHLVGEARTTNP